MGYSRLLRDSSRLFCGGFGIVLRDDDDAGSPSESNWPESIVHKASPHFLPYAETVTLSMSCSVHPASFFPCARFKCSVLPRCETPWFAAVAVHIAGFVF